ncbi:uncharacterized protein LOC143297175 [Babylonia areolata]|uniref:uncharacterized protein LOC143297175 n=1 Tax=Babylonia areolata TaxID=304850 RepID=UPI003FD26E08
MALIPGSYARAAGLQSEINKVTITRVAGSEVQFRRTIDTYQRDLRYHVTQIGREQKQLKRSMRRYSRKLHDSRKQQKQRKAKVKEDAERLRQQAESFKQAEEAVKLASHVTSKPLPENRAEGNVQSTAGELAAGQNSDPSTQPQDAPSVLQADPNDVAEVVGENTASVVETAEQGGARGREDGGNPQSYKAFLTKGSLPYLRAKPTHKAKSHGHDVCHQRGEASSGLGDNSTLIKSCDVELFLPIIDEEGEGSGNHSADKPTQVDLDDSPSVTLSKAPVAPSAGVPVQTVSITSLNTKAFSKNEIRGTPKEADESELSDDPASLPALSRALEDKGKRVGKAGVSFGDLIKLQHMPSSSSKRLFKLVDRLASKHGIKDLPDVPSVPGPPSVDPRSSGKLKLKRHNPGSKVPDGIVRHAAVLYSMKYGYRVDDATFLGDALPPILLSQDTADEFPEHSDVMKTDNIITKLTVMSQGSTHANEVHNNYEDTVSDMTSAKFSSLSVRRESLEVTSPVSALSEGKWSAMDDTTSAEPAHSPEAHASRPGPRRSGQVPTMSELSHQASRVRDRTTLAGEAKPSAPSLGPGDSTQYQSAGKVTPSPRRSRSRSRRDSVSSQLQKRLTSSQRGEGAQPNMAWQSAFGRLKLLHTLEDLSQHFRKNHN